VRQGPLDGIGERGDFDGGRRFAGGAVHVELDQFPTGRGPVDLVPSSDEDVEQGEDGAEARDRDVGDRGEEDAAVDDGEPEQAAVRERRADASPPLERGDARGGQHL